MKYLIFFLLAFVMSEICNADFTAFDFSLGRYIVDEGIGTKASLKYSLSGYEEEEFLIRPVIRNGIVEIFNSRDGVWVSSNTDLGNLPSLKDTAVIRIKGLGVEKSSIYFEIYNTVNGDSYKTPEKIVWSGKIYSKYIESVNKFLEANKVAKEESNSQQLNYLDTVKIDINEKEVKRLFLNTSTGKIILFLVYLLSFFISYYVGYKNEGRKQSRKIFLDTKSRIYGVSGKIH